MPKAILYDSTLCIGCKACEGACAERWGLPYNDKVAAEEKISAHKLTAIETHGDKFSRRLCMNCVQPACASVCPVGALQKTALGPVTYDAIKLHGMPLLHAGLPVPGAVVRMGQAVAQDAQVRHVLRAAEPGQADRVRRGLPGGRHQERRPRRAGGRSQPAHRRKARSVLPQGLRPQRSGRNLRAVPLGGALRADRPAHQPAAGTPARDYLARAGAGARRGLHRLGAAGRHLVDHQPPRRSLEEGGRRK